MRQRRSASAVVPSVLLACGLGSRPLAASAPRQRPSGPRHLIPVLAAAVLLAGSMLALTPASNVAQGQPAASPSPVQLDYTINLEDRALLAQGKVQMTWRASGFQGRITAFCLQVDNHDYAVDQANFAVQGSAKGQWEYHPQNVDPSNSRPACPAGFRSVVQGLDGVQATFQLNVLKTAFSACNCEYNSFLGAEWGVVKAEALSIPFSYAFFNEPGCAQGQQCPPPFHATVHFQLPASWSVEAPWAKIDARSYELTGSERPLPRGFFAVGNFTPEMQDETASIGKRFVYVRLSQELKQKDLLFDYLRKATPYYQSVYGNVTGSRILVISAGAPMFTGGLGSTDSLFVHQNATLETVAHEFAHVWQRFQTVDNLASPGGTSIWVNEGDADLHGALSRFVTEIQQGFNYSALNDNFRQSYDRYSSDPDFQQPLSAAAYGAKYEQVAYKKGLFTLLHLDSELRRLTNNASRLNDYLAALNGFYDTSVINRSAAQERVTNDDLLTVANQVARRSNSAADFRPFWDSYVSGTAWPPFHDAPVEAPVVFDALWVDPERPVVGENVTISVTVTNLKSSPLTRSVDLMVDAATVQRQTVTLSALQSLPVRFSVSAGEAGKHAIQVAYLRQNYTTLRPALIVVDRIGPAGNVTPEAGAEFTLSVQLRNLGEAPTSATVAVRIGSGTQGAVADVEGLGTATVPLRFTATEEGNTTAQVTVFWPGGSLQREGGFIVLPRDSDRDGVPDSLDAYPNDPHLWQKSPVNDVRTRVPGFDGLAAPLAAAGIALAARRRRRPGR